MADTEIQAILELLSALFISGRTGILMLFLVAAAVIDSRSHRIPNWLVLSGALYAIVYNTLVPLWPNGTILFPLAGLALGLALFLPIYLLRAMGAGDVKLLAMVGAFIGPGAVWQAALASLIVGGFLAILYVLFKGTARRLYRNLSSIFRMSVADAMTGTLPSFRVSTAVSAGRLPYGIAIALGTISFLVLHQLAFI